jgi:hypothetical protein
MNDSSGAGEEVAAPRVARPRGAGARARTLLPWLLAAAVLGWLLHRLPLATLRAELARGPWLLLTAFVALTLVLVLMADSLAASVALRRTGSELPYGRVLVMRGAAYLVTALHPVAGQGTFGWLLARTGRGGWEAGGVLVLLLATQLLTLALVGALGLLAAPGWLREPALPMVAIVGAGFALYLLLIAVRPRWCVRLPLLRPLLAAGVGGHLVAIAARLPHVALLVVLPWMAFRLWGIAVPLPVGLAYMPLVLLVAALPITPSGLGTVQALQVALFAPWAAGATGDHREAVVLAFGLTYAGLSLLVQVVAGAVCARLLREPPAAAG